MKICHPCSSLSAAFGLHRSLQALSILFLSLLLSACGGEDHGASHDEHASHTAVSPAGTMIAAQGSGAQGGPASQSAARSPVHLDVFKSPTCGCCQLWIDHAQESGFHAVIHHPEDLTREKLQRGIGFQLHSCHTSVASDGSVFEGHIPANLIHRYLQDRPADTLGLSVPGMPIGSPGMEVGDRFTPYDVLLLHADGSTTVYHRVETAAEQY
jgi:hypothetical protein